MEQNYKKTISIIIATWNAELYLRRSLNAIIEQLNSRVELIIIDGLSTDNTKSIINEYKNFIAYTCSEKDKGIYDAWNKGIKKSHGDWIMFLGADDCLLKNTINNYLKYIDETDTTNIDLISSVRTMTSKKNKKLYDVGDLWTWPQCISGMQISHPGALQKKTLYQEVGLYNLDFHIVGDYELLMRKGPKLKAVFLNFTSVLMQEGGMSDSFKAIREYYKALKSNRYVHNNLAVKSYIIMSTKYLIKKTFRVLGLNIHKDGKGYSCSRFI